MRYHDRKSQFSAGAVRVNSFRTTLSSSADKAALSEAGGLDETIGNFPSIDDTI
jgi:hypothetical protein